MSKPGARRVPADTCQVVVAGEPQAPHVGEWVELVGSPSIRERRLVQAMIAHALASPDFDEDESVGDRLERVAHGEEADRQFDAFCAMLGARVTAWSLTDDRGEPLPQPDGSSEPILGLHTEEVWWLWNAYRGDVLAERKNGSNGSGPISGTLPEQPTRSRSRPR